MIHEECVVSLWHFPDEERMCSVVYVSPTVICVKGLPEGMTRANQRAFAEMCFAKGIKHIYTDRSPVRSLPMVRRVHDHMAVTIEELLDRLTAGEQAKPLNGNTHKRRSSDV